MAAGSSSKVDLRDIAIVGGGCYGCFYAGQLEQARLRGRVSYRQLLIVDRNPDCQFAREIGGSPTQRLVVADWSTFFDQFLGEQSDSSRDRTGDVIVPSPLMPHLMYQWLVRHAEAQWPDRAIETVALPSGPGTPYDVVAPDFTRYVSYADWICPTHCIEPAVCPVIRGPRSWDMADGVQRLTERLAASRPTAGPVLFLCHHRVFGVGMFDVAAVLDGKATMLAAGSPGGPVDLMVGTISHCHGALNLLRLGARS